MGVMCSLLGHDYGDADVERERTEQGEEVVRTAKRVERCRNCGHERTVSENTEVTALEAAVGVVREPDGTVVAATDGMGEPNEALSPSAPRNSERRSREQSEADGGIVIENDGETERALDAPNGENTEQEDENEPDDERAVGAIDEVRNIEPKRHDTGPHRAPGEWPTEPETERASNAGTREGLGSSGSLAATPRAGESSETDATAAMGGSSTLLYSPESTENGTDTESATPTRPIDRRPGDSFACASCGFTSAVADSPLRAGDICPDCGHGYLAWETRKG